MLMIVSGMPLEQGVFLVPLGINVGNQVHDFFLGQAIEHPLRHDRNVRLFPGFNLADGNHRRQVGSQRIGKDFHRVARLFHD